MLPNGLLAAISVTVFFIGLSYAYLLARFFTIPGVISAMVERWNDEEWLEENMGTSWRLMANKMIASLNGSAAKDIQNIGNNMPAVQEAILSRLPAELPPGDALKALKMCSMKPGMAEQLGSVMENVQMLQQMGLINLQGGGSSETPIIHQGNGGGGW